RLLARIDPIAHRSVDVDQVLGRLRSELGQVEVGVATHERVCRPLHDPDLSREAPTSLVLLELESGAARVAAAEDPEDVRVHVQLVWRHAPEPPAQPADELPAGIGTGYVVAG